MTTVEITITLPETLIRDARELGVLTDEAVAALVQAEVDRRVADLVNMEIQAHRAEKAARERRPPPS
jgi:hypothetical protein